MRYSHKLAIQDFNRIKINICDGCGANEQRAIECQEAIERLLKYVKALEIESVVKEIE